MIKLFSSPYPYSPNNTKRLRKATFMGVFVFLFLLGFQPFGLNEYTGGIVKLTLGYGLTCFIVMVILNMAIPTIFNNYFSEEKWTVGKQISWSLINVSFIGLANLLYSNFVGIANFSIISLVSFEVYTIAIAIFPLLLFVITNYKRLSSKFEKSAELINSSIQQVQASIKTNKTNLITIDSENISESLSLRVDDLIYIQSSDNYITVYFFHDDKIRSMVLRNTLKSVALQLEKYSNLFRCHKSFLINLNKVNHISGNAQGYKLHVQYIDEIIPVSRSHNKTIKNKLTIRP